jgi:hypothetical protein
MVRHLRSKASIIIIFTDGVSTQITQTHNPTLIATLQLSQLNLSRRKSMKYYTINRGKISQHNVFVVALRIIFRIF